MRVVDDLSLLQAHGTPSNAVTDAAALAKTKTCMPSRAHSWRQKAWKARASASFRYAGVKSQPPPNQAPPPTCSPRPHERHDVQMLSSLQLAPKEVLLPTCGLTQASSGQIKRQECSVGHRRRESRRCCPCFRYPCPTISVLVQRMHNLVLEHRHHCRVSCIAGHTTHAHTL